MHTIIYTSVKNQHLAVPKLKELRAMPKDKVSARVAEFWQGEIELCDLVLVGDNCEKVADAYKDAGITVKDLFEKTKKAEAPKPVEVVDPVVVAEPVVDVKVEPEVQQEYRGRGRPRKEG